MVLPAFKLEGEALLADMDDVMDDIADTILADSQNNIVQKRIIDEGSLLKSGNVERSFLDKKIVYSAPHSTSIEFGRDPGVMPPVQPIIGWVQRKLGEPDEKVATRIAWAIATDLKENGTFPRPFLRPAIEKAAVRFS